jgi:carboxyl-terminal processing protease
MPLHGPHRFRQPKLGVLAFAAIALSLFVVFAPRDMRQSARSRADRDSSNMQQDDGASFLHSTSVLLDSILSLVQSYYVDSDRVAGGQLIAGTMRSLAYAIPALKFVESDGAISISNGEEILEFKIDDVMDYDDVLGRLKSLIAFCERIDVRKLMNKGENIMLGSESEESSIVVNALLSSLDAHSSLMSAEAYQDLRQDTEGAFGGLGVLVGIRENILTVLKPLPRSPATKLGIQRHDKIVSINGHPTFGMSLDRLVGHMRGKPGTVAELEMLSPGAWSPRTLKLKREVIEVDSVEAYEHHSGGLHVLRLDVENFASRTSKEVAEKIRRFRTRYAIGGVVLDLRGNPGGLLDQAVSVSDIFLDRGVVVTTRGRREEIERATRGFDEVNFPLAVLMDEDSASASEIVAGALQDNGRAVVIGQPSFGKGSVQTVFELPEDRALKLTIARYFTPSAKSIQNTGIMPDVWIQPVMKSASNDNLFGPFRYRNEQFLPNHLSAVAEPRFQIRPALKGYVLQGDLKSDSGDKYDPEMEVAMAIFAKIRATYGISPPESARRSGHALALATPDVKQLLHEMSAQSSKWLKEMVSVDWVTDPMKQDEFTSLALQVKSGQGGLVVNAGSMLSVPWRVTNLGRRDAQNVSVFLQSPVAGLETREILVGRVPAGQSREGLLKVFMPPTLSVGQHYVNAGIAIDAQAVPNAQGEFLVNVRDEVKASLSASIRFIDGDKSKREGVLEASETARLRLRVANETTEIARDVAVKITHFGGEQISIPAAQLKIGRIDPKAERFVDVYLSGREKITSSSFVVGVTVSAAEDFVDFSTSSQIYTSFSAQSASDSAGVSH